MTHCVRLAVGLALIASGVALPHTLPAEQTTYCNPIDIEYQYNFEQRQRGISYRAAADPVIILHEGEYYLFATISGGWWHSADLVNWKYVKPNIWPKEDMCAPAAVSVKGTLYLFQSTFERRPIYIVRDPKCGILEPFNPLLPYIPGAAGPWDPALFHDDETDRWFMYFGSSNLYPIYGIELDFAQRLTYIDTARELIALHPELHGWERFGRDHTDPRKPFIEGAWMTRHRGKYYLQYAAPGTEHNVYANGTYVGESPLGPFTYSPNNPIAYKPGGFVVGAGHGNTFLDKHGNFWNTGTPWVAVNFDFERRIAMFPAGFDGDGYMFANTRFGDFPHSLPTGQWTNRDELFTGWMLLSYRKPCTASSAESPYIAANMTDENPRTFWLANSSEPGAWVTMDLERVSEVRAVQVNYTDYKSGLFASDTNVYTQFKINTSVDGHDWKPAADLSQEKRDRPNAYIELPAAVRARYIKFEHVHIGSPNLAISDIRVFGRSDVASPATPGGLNVVRDPDPRDAHVSWESVPGAVGYNVLWGLSPEKLYQCYQVFVDQGTKLDLRALTVGQDYVFVVEAFNESGVSKRSPAVWCK